MPASKSKARNPTQVPEKLESQAIPEKVVERRVIVYKTCIDPTVIKLAVEKMKKELFVTSGFLKPKPEDIRYISIDKSYEPYIYVDGKYFIDYYRKRLFKLGIDEKAHEIIILNNTLKTELEIEPTKGAHGFVKIEGEEHFLFEDRAYLIIDKAGKELSVEQVPFAPSEEEPKKILNEFGEKMGKLEVSPDAEIDVLRSKIVKRPPQIDRVADELFEVSDRSVIYVPIYEISFKNEKTGEKKTVKIDGVTAKVVV